MSFNSHGSISNRTVQVVDSGDMRVSGDIDSGSFVFLVNTGGSITVEGKIDGNSQVTLKADGDVKIGTRGGQEDKKIDGDCRSALKPVLPQLWCNIIGH